MNSTKKMSLTRTLWALIAGLLVISPVVPGTFAQGADGDPITNVCVATPASTTGVTVGGSNAATPGESVTFTSTTTVNSDVY